MKIWLLFIALIISTLGQAQSRDTTVTKTLYYLTTDSLSPLDSSVVWSSKLNDYLLYSRLEMGNRMNQGIKYQTKARTKFLAGTACLALSSGAFIWSAHSDPVIYVENHHKYTRSYYNSAIRKRDIKVTVGTGLAIAAVYFYWRSYKHNKKSRWSISPDGIKYNISSRKR